MFINLLNFSVIVFLIANLILKDKLDSIYDFASIINVILIVLFFFVFFIKKKIKYNLFIILTSAYISFFLINIFVKKKIYQETAASLIQKYKKNKINLRPSVFPTLFLTTRRC